MSICFWGLQRKKLQAPTRTCSTKNFADPSLLTLPLAISFLALHPSLHPPISIPWHSIISSVGHDATLFTQTQYLPLQNLHFPGHEGADPDDDQTIKGYGSTQTELHGHMALSYPLLISLEQLHFKNLLLFVPVFRLWGTSAAITGNLFYVINLHQIIGPTCNHVNYVCDLLIVCVIHSFDRLWK